MAKMNPVCVYLAGPIDGIDQDRAQRWRALVADLFPSVLFFDPSRAWHNAGPEMAWALDSAHRQMICCADGVLANLRGEGRAIGTIREIEYARSQGRPVAVAGLDQNVTLMAYDLLCEDGVEEAMTRLLQVCIDRRERGMMSPFQVFFGRMVEDDDE